MWSHLVISKNLQRSKQYAVREGLVQRLHLLAGSTATGWRCSAGQPCGGERERGVKRRPMLRSYLHLRRLQLLVHLQRVVMEPHLHKHLENQTGTKLIQRLSSHIATKTGPSSVSATASTAQIIQFQLWVLVNLMQQQQQQQHRGPLRTTVGKL